MFKIMANALSKLYAIYATQLNYKIGFLLFTFDI
jgi:hypothetical protein